MMTSDMPMSDRLTRILGLLFCVMMIAGSAGAVFKTATETFENRKLADWPSLSLSGLADGTYFSGLTTAVRDRHGLRERALLTKNWLSLNIFEDKTTTGLTFGRDGWLFLRGSAAAVCRDATTPQELTTQIAAYFESLPPKAQKILMLLPEKDYFYASKAVDRHGISSLFSGAAKAAAKSQAPHLCANARYNRELASLSNVLGASLLDVRTHLMRLQKKSPDPIYFKQDTHWTFETSTFIGGLLVNRLSFGLWSADDLRVSDNKPFVQDLSRIAGLPVEAMGMNTESMRKGVRESGRDFSERHSERHPVRQFMHESSNPDAKLIRGRTVIVYDSFMIPNFGAISPYFSDVTWVFWDDFSQPKVQARIQKADRVIIASVYRLVQERALLMQKAAKDAGN
jgi:SGNH hydrolase-like domain, acetyltransferase AlgX